MSRHPRDPDVWSSPWWLVAAACVLIGTGGFLLGSGARHRSPSARPVARPPAASVAAQDPLTGLTPEQVVERFHEAMTNGELDAAWDCLSPEQQAKEDRASFDARCRNTRQTVVIGGRAHDTTQTMPVVECTVTWTGPDGSYPPTRCSYTLAKRDGVYRIIDRPDLGSGLSGPSAAAPSEPQPRVSTDVPRTAGGDTKTALAAGQVMLVGIPSDWSPANPSPLDQVPAGAVILFRRNTGVGSQGIGLLCADVRDYVITHHPGALAPLIAIDHEGGQVNRLKNVAGVTAFPDNYHQVAGLSAAAAADKAGQVGATMGRELRALGVDWDLAPVLEVVAKPAGDAAIGYRSYGSYAALVGACGSAFVEGLHRGGALSCAKHWPSYAPAGAVDPHKSVARASISQPVWREKHLPPFQDAVAAGADALMVGHVVYTFLGSGKPASVDPRAYQLARDELGFDGPILTDDLEMGGVVNQYPDFGSLAVAAVQAGADMILVCWTPSRAVKAHQALVQAAESGKLYLGEHAARIRQLQERQASR